jgi:hypothetical protein
MLWQKSVLMDELSVKKLIEEIYQQHYYHLTKRKIQFLLDWFTAAGKKNSEFGFIGERGMSSQLKKAVAFLLETEKEWMFKYLNSQTNLPFCVFFVEKAHREGINFSETFADKLLKKEKDDEHL